ncbi:MAG TPA: transposase, partial [Clostridiaceae bacterium]
HILVKTGDMHIGNLISRIHSIYTRFFNNKYNYLGHLFQDRYHIELVEDDAQLLSTSRYIHLNPVKAKMVENPQDYEWSSYSIYIGLKEEKIIESERILSYFKRENARESYRCFVESAMKKNEIEKGE